MTFEQLLASVNGGNIFAYAFATDESYRLINEVIDGKETGNVSVGTKGGNVGHKAAVDILLNVVKRQMIRAGLAEFATGAVELVAGYEDATDLLNGLTDAKISMRVLTGAADRFVKQIGLSFELTELQTCELLYAVCGQADTKEVISKAGRVTAADLDAAKAAAKAENEKRADERYAAAAALRGLTVEQAQIQDAETAAAAAKTAADKATADAAALVKAAAERAAAATGGK